MCPLDETHGYMVWLNGTDSQYCSHQSHDPHKKRPATRKLWPTGHDSFRKAVITTTLPEIDIQLLGG